MLDDLSPARLRELAGDADEVAYDVRYRGQSHELTVRTEGDLREAFEVAHEERYGYRDAEATVELVTVRRSFTEAGARVDWRGERELEGSTLFVPEGWTRRWTDRDVLFVERER
jgi:N-methylhydantoinase A/oxoprolinase/acetone carboxylase beta subunit